MSGKGSHPRPYSVPQEEFDARHERIFGRREPKPRYVPPPLPQPKEQERNDEPR
jgi:hypothetical protein